MKVLGLSAGNPGGSADILLKAALRAAEDDGADVSFVSLADLELSQGPAAKHDDAAWFWDQLMESSGFIVSTPIYSRTVPGRLRLLGDKISGPQADAAFTAELLRLRASGENVSADFTVDERVLRPRVGGFIATGGAIPPHWKALTLPIMHTLTTSMQCAIADQMQCAGSGSRRSIVLNPAAIERAAELGRNVASQLGLTYDEVKYLGDPGVCPMCHLDVIVLMPQTVSGSRPVECASCGAAGSLKVIDGAVRVEFTPAGQAQSVLTLAEKLAHFNEVQQTAAAQGALASTIEDRARSFQEWDRAIRPPRQTLATQTTDDDGR